MVATCSSSLMPALARLWPLTRVLAFNTVIAVLSITLAGLSVEPAVRRSADVPIRPGASDDVDPAAEPDPDPAAVPGFARPCGGRADDGPLAATPTRRPQRVRTAPFGAAQARQPRDRPGARGRI